MPFPQGGDFTRNVSGLFKVVKTDRRVCVNDNGTTVCNAGHKLKFPGTCTSQSIGTFNSTDASFQPAFPVCTLDYDSSGFSNGLIYAFGESTSTGNIISTEGFSYLHPLFQNLESVTSVQKIYKFLESVTVAGKIFSLMNSISGAYSTQEIQDGTDSFFQLGQFNPGAIYRGSGVDSPLFDYDVYSHWNMISRLAFYFIESQAAHLDSRRDPGSSHYAIGYDATISGSEDLCLGDEIPPYLVLRNPTSSGTHLAPRNQVVDLSIGDATAGVDISKVFIRLYSETRFPSSYYDLVVAGADATGGRVSVTGDQDEYRFVYTPNWQWDYNEVVRVTISGADLPLTVDGNPFFCQDTGVNHMAGEIWFQVLNQADFPATLTAEGDYAPPYISYTSPASGTANNNVFNSLVFRVADDLTGVNLGSLNVSVGGEEIIVNGSPVTSETLVTGTPAEYTVTYTPNDSFNYGESVTVDVSVYDRSVFGPNLLDTSYSVSFIPDSTTRVENFLPAVGLTKNLEDVDISLELYDDWYGIDPSSSSLIINGSPVVGDVTVLTSGIRITYHPPNQFDYGEPINVIVHSVNLNTTAPVILDVPYVLYYGQSYYYKPNERFEHDHAVSVYVQARNKKINNKYLATGYNFTTYRQPSSNLSASIIPYTPWQNLSAELQVVAPVHRYGETVTVEIYVEDFEGNALGPYTFTYTIESS